jgi:hypothetical protein
MRCNHGHPWLWDRQTETIPLYPRCPLSPLGLHTIPFLVPPAPIEQPRGLAKSRVAIFLVISWFIKPRELVGYTPRNPSTSNVYQVTEQTLYCRPMCKCLYVNIYIYIYTHTYIHTCIHTYINTYIHTDKHTNIHTYKHTITYHNIP